MKVARRFGLLLLVIMLVGVALRRPLGRWAIGGLQQVKGKQSIGQRLEQFGPAVRSRLGADFARTGVSYPPCQLVLVGLKQEKQLEVWIAGRSGEWKWLRTYAILAASGELGPKLKEGDRQVPEGLYKIESLNPNSLFHLALRVNYPNADDRARAADDGRTALGSDIMIHGKSASVGCLAMGDEAAEDLFGLAAETGIENIAVILSPVDFRTRDLPPDRPPGPPWVSNLYAQIRTELLKLKR